jgi:NADPH2:quinone reductase
VKAIRVDAVGGAEVLHAVDIAAPVAGPDEVLVRHTAIGLNFIDVYTRSGSYKREVPFVPGREGVGVVKAVGAEVTTFTPGMRVGYPEAPKLGSYAELNAVPARYCVELPPEIEDDVACAVMLQGMTAHYLVTDSFAAGRGDRILIHAAAGGVGRLLVQLAKARGATVFATAGGPEKCALATSAGADHTIDYRATDFAPEVMRLTGNAGVDCVYDSVGKDTWERGLAILRPRGSFVLFGAASGPVPPIDPQRFAAAGSIFFSRPTAGHFMRTHGELTERMDDLFDHIRGGRLDVRIGKVYPLADAVQAHRDLEARATTGKSILRP